MRPASSCLTAHRPCAFRLPEREIISHSTLASREIPEADGSLALKKCCKSVEMRLNKGAELCHFELHQVIRAGHSCGLSYQCTATQSAHITHTGYGCSGAGGGVQAGGHNNSTNADSPDWALDPHGESRAEPGLLHSSQASQAAAGSSPDQTHLRS